MAQKSITVYKRASRIKIFDERTYQEVEISFDNDDFMEEMLLKLTAKLLEED